MLRGARQFVSSWRDERRRARKLLRRVRAADVAFVSAGKSGRTWLRAMFAHLLHQRVALPFETLLDFESAAAAAPSAPRLLFTGVFADRPAPTGGTWGAELARVPKFALLTRDPRDVVVSFYFQLTERATERDLRRKRAQQDELRRTPIYDFMFDERLGLPRLLRFARQWEAVAAAHPKALTIRYEDLRSAPVATFGRVARFVDPAVADEEIAAAVAFGEFDAMQAREREGFFTADRLRPRDALRTDTYKARRGKIGGYRDYLTAEQAAEVDRYVEASWPQRLLATADPPLPAA